MAELVTIEAGMGADTSIPALNSNYKNLNDELATGGPTVSAKVQINNGKVTGSATFTRQGGLVMVNSYLSLINEYDGVIIAAADIPVGCSLPVNVAAACDVVSDSHAYLGSQVKTQSGNIRLKTTNELSNNKATDSGEWSFVYPTNDDFPN